MSEKMRTFAHGMKKYWIQVWEKMQAAWQRFVEKYETQQELIRRQSEVKPERITIMRAVLTFMETWGLGSRNIFYTMWHLIWRPGYMISDYLNGRRNRYLQPFFMFFVLTLILVQLAWVMKIQLPKNKDMTLMAFEVLSSHKDLVSVEQTTKILHAAQWLDEIHDWRDENRGWDILIHSIGIMLVSWLLWRKSPRVGTAEWVVESGEYIQGYNFAEIVSAIAYILCQLQMISMVAMVLFHKLPFDHMWGLAMIIPRIILFAVMLIDFKQLFQRDWWPTIWRTLLIVIFF
jgi:hypothetical protein